MKVAKAIPNIIRIQRLRLVLAVLAGDPDPAQRSPTWNQGPVTVLHTTCNLELVNSGLTGHRWHPHLHLPALLPGCTFIANSEHANRTANTYTGLAYSREEYVCRLGAMFIFRIFRAIHRSLLHILNYPPSTDT